MSSKLKSIFASLFLLYFLLYAVSPVSAAAATAQELPDGIDKVHTHTTAISPPPAATLPPDEPRDLLEKQDNHTNLFIFDMVLWEILQKTKPSDRAESVVTFIKKGSLASGKHILSRNIDCIITGIIAVPSPFAGFTSDDFSDSVYYLPLVCLEFSGLSPPVVS